ncbi:hypothetical protein [Comamonas testosteroni]|uniref:plasmid mobilization protein n=1 Tax=Comamonas testosteroni TaxID=285 RepID=UPI0026E9A148|nr:hypothetical protein [Comamonas testosteroni]
MKTQTKTEVIPIRCTPQEKEFIRLTATLKEFNSVSDYILSSTIYPQNLDKKKSQSLVYEFNKIGVNFNQLTKKINQSDELTKHDKIELLQYFNYFYAQFEELLKVHRGL